ncbi:hypothetical protein Q8A67_005585 [Cirrhinus molitorella]|uniref:Uncharacterized protein n=1 Tax=Cirrhinus molitorella TaxID=172907 RepID=A0AA88Q446_9TELE|nr:hypothetical protein Q8A67_005585 [Cirrhinus molitorella]
MFPSSHRCNLSKLPYESEASRGCSAKSLCSAAQFSSVSESVRAPGSSSSSVKWQDVPPGSHRIRSRRQGSREQGNKERVENGRQVERGSYHPRPHLNRFHLRNVLKDTY